MRTLPLILIAVGVVAAAPPKKAEELFQTSKVWSLHLTFTAEQWAAMQPKGQFPFGGGRPGGGPGGGGPVRFGPGGPGGPPGGFGPAMMLAPAFLKGDSNGDKQLSQEEFRALGERWFTEWDTKKAGKLGADELRGGMMQLLQAGMGNMIRIGGPGRGPGRSGRGPGGSGWSGFGARSWGLRRPGRGG